jgi:hypothetical protein
LAVYADCPPGGEEVVRKGKTVGADVNRGNREDSTALKLDGEDYLTSTGRTLKAILWVARRLV